ncbi:MAG: endo alpha-1,4 polygalactosaminidase, partial [bacterium]
MFKINCSIFLLTTFLFVIISILLLSCTVFLGKNRKSININSWACFYGEDSLNLSKLMNYDLVIMEPDISGYTPPIQGKTIYIGYISIGEAESFRWYWPQVKDSDFLLWENKNWKNDYLIDIRSGVWQDILIRQVIPHIISKGFKGLFFDTIDTPIFLEEENGQKFRGSTKALVKFIRRVRKTFPDLILISNNGLKAVSSFGKYMDLLVVESLNTTYDFQDKKYKKADLSWRNVRLNHLNNFLEKHGNMPVLVIDYLDRDNH